MGEPTLIDRRTAMGAFAGVATLAGAAPAASSTTMPSASPELARLIAVYRESLRAWDSYRTDAFDPMEEAFIQGAQAHPHRRTTTTYANVAGDRVSMSTEPWALAQAKTIVAMGHGDADYLATAQEAVALAEERETALRQLSAALRAEEIKEREFDLMSANTKAVLAVLAFDALTIADVLAKVRIVDEAEWWENPEATDAITADLRRLAFGEVAHG